MEALDVKDINDWLLWKKHLSNRTSEDNIGVGHKSRHVDMGSWIQTKFPGVYALAY